MISAKNKHQQLLIVGAIHIDDVATACKPLLAGASNPVSWSRSLGGVAANVACAAARCNLLSGDVQFIGAVGDDLYARSLALGLSQSGVKACLCTINGRATGRYSAIMDQGELYLGLSDVSLAEALSSERLVEMLPPKPGTRADSTPASDQNTVPRPLPELPTTAACTALLLDANLSEASIKTLASWANTGNIPLASMSVSPAKSHRILPIARQTSILFCNRKEAQAMLGKSQAEQASLVLLAEGLTNIGFSQFVLTDGSQPVLVQSRDGQHQLTITQNDSVHNVNGSGDALAGASFAAWASGIALADAVRDYGLTEAAKVVQGKQQPVSLNIPSV